MANLRSDSRSDMCYEDRETSIEADDEVVGERRCRCQKDRDSGVTLTSRERDSGPLFPSLLESGQLSPVTGSVR